ncbi:major capsid protein P2 [Pseudemcibacter aquimaris]|uniref:major capsid protein P2 n=1 Tax=Pseudemcibacter aquimaris TaxID=2857064 RepID=UPI0020132712|nr:major capsid protein P2 [Pseudemcibacter aquimaris]MCC3859769.1 major capsid protein P2 [Pseudemcibacter aquimaris]WDU60163.1 hypothetical protein KW060_07820 [Pseudemcibacter aquimaris]
MQSFSGVVSGGRAVLDVDVIGTYHAILLHHQFGASPADATKANFITNIQDISIYLNGTVQQEYTPTELINICEEKNIPWKDGILPIFFSQPDSLTPKGEDITSWGMADIQTCQIVVNFNTVTSPLLSASRVWMPANITMGDIITTDRVSVNAAGLSSKVVDLEIEQNRVVNAVYCFTDQILTVKAKVGQEVIFEASKDTLDFLRETAGYAPQSDIFVLSGKQLTARYTDVINGVNAIDPNKPHKLRLEFGFDTSAVDFDIITEQVGPRKA